MLFLAIIMAAFVVYTLPGLALARGMYAASLKEINSRPVQVVPPKPERPRMKMNEILHDNSPIAGRRCSRLDNVNRACNCSARNDWLDIKNGWIDYNEWVEKYGHITNGVYREPTVNMTPIYLSVIGWPLVGAAMYIKGGAKNIPDYRAIERMENELRELN